MDLTDIPGIGPAYSQRLRDADVPDAEALAAVEDVDALAQRASIPAARLAGFREEARRRLEISGIPIFDPILDNAQTLVRSLDHLAHEVEEAATGLKREVQEKGIKGIAAEVGGNVMLGAQNLMSHFRQLLEGRQRGGAGAS